MNDNKAQKVILLSATTVLAFGILGHYKREKSMPPIGFFIAVGITFFFISAISEFLPELAAALAITIMVTTLFLNGEDIFGYLADVGGIDYKTGTTTKKGKV